MSEDSNYTEADADSEDALEVHATNSNSIWNKSGDCFQPDTIANNVELLPPGVYRHVQTMMGWHLERYQSRFEFPYKIYGTNSNIVVRALKAWNNMDGNLGLLLNGIKGTGKSVTAQIVANNMIDMGLPVLVVDKPLDIGNILTLIKQDCVVLWDEFEKTHSDREHQQLILSAIDGISRNAHKRMYLLTTNNKHLDENFIDRPSRIRYVWEFDRLDRDVMNELIDDLLEEDVVKYKPDLIAYLEERKVLSIDVVKAACMELNVFKESPSEFEPVMNLNKKVASSYKVEYRLAGSKGDFKPLMETFTYENDLLNGIKSRDWREDFASRYGLENHYGFYASSGFEFDIVGVDVEHGEYFYAKIDMPVRNTEYKNVTEVNGRYGKLYMEPKPSDWKRPAFSEMKHEDINEMFDNGGMYGGEGAVYEIRFIPVYTRYGGYGFAGGSFDC